jgi:arabinose-5-phosphate isomerase
MATTKAKLPSPVEPNAAADRGIATARRVLAIEADALRALAASLGPSFIAALDALAAVTGRVIVTGMGKSGHVARKIAATLASTGTPALFVHPAEASHGDLGMVTGKDAVLALSNSGETTELADIIAYAKRYAIPLIAMTSVSESALARAASVALVYPAADEACPMGLAPTTSTTLMLALGDALAVSLLERKGFSADDFRVLHPGGKLGRQLLRVADIMHAGARIPRLAPTAPMTDAIVEMTGKSLGCVGIVDKAGRLKGIITDGDIRRHIGDANLLGRTAADIMSRNVKTIRAEALVSEALQIMNTRSITALFVVEDGRLVGILHIHDCLRAGVA